MGSIAQPGQVQGNPVSNSLASWPIVRAWRNFWRSPGRRVGVWIQRFGQRSGYIARVLWLCIYPVIAFLVGVAMLGLVDQTREFYAQFGSRDAFAGVRPSQAWLFGLSVLLWAAALWYTTRLLLGQRYPRDEPVPHDVQRFAEKTRTWVPRGFGYFGLLVAACMLATFAPREPETTGLAALCALQVAAHALIMSVIGRPVRFFAPILASICAAGFAAATVTENTQVFLSAMAQIIGTQILLGAVGSWAAHRAVWLRIGMTIVLVAATAFYAMRVDADRRMFAVVLAVVASAFFAFTIVRRQWLMTCTVDGATEPQPERAAAVQRAGLTPATRRVMAAVLVCFAGLILGFYWMPQWLGESLGALAIVFIGLAVWMMFGVLVFVHWPKRHGLPSLALLPMVLVTLASTHADNHALYGTQFRPGPDQRAELVADFTRWHQARLAQGDAPDAPVLFVAAAGGGLRAAHWTARVLAAIDDATCNAFGRRMYAISGVSGGSLGAATYVALKADQPVDAPTDPAAACASAQPHAPLSHSVERVLGRDFLAPVVGSFLFTDALQRWIPTPVIVRDRAWVLAEHWADAWHEAQGTDRLHAPLGALYADDTTRRLPMLFLNATSVDTGRRAIATQVRLAAPDAIDVYAGGLKTDGLSLAQAVLNSARFTYVSPAGTLIGQRGELVGVADRLVDGGYFDNSGAETLLDVIGTLERNGVLQARQAYVVLISNEATAARLCRDVNAVPPDVSVGAITAHTPGSSETLSPIEAMLSTRVARASLAMERVVRQVGCDHVIELGMFADRYPQEMRDSAREPALGWFLSRNSVRLIELLAAEYGGAAPAAH